MLPAKIVEHLPLSKLKEICKQTKSSKQMIRFQAIIWSYETHFYPKVEDISKRLDITKSAIYYWIRAWNKHGLEGITIKKPNGAPKKLTGSEREQLINDILHNPRDIGYDFSTWTLKAIEAHILKKFGKTMTIGGIHDMLKRNRISLVVPRPMPVKGDLEKNSSSNMIWKQL